MKSFDNLETDSESLIQKYKDHGFYERENAQRAMNMHIYAEKKTGIDVWEGYWDYLLQLIYNIEKNQLQTDIAEIKKGNFGKLKTVDTVMEQLAISSAEEIQDILKPKLTEPSKPKPEAQEDQWGEMLRFINPKMYLIYKIMSNPQIRQGYIDAFNQYQQYSKLLKSKKPILKDKNLKQRKAENIKPKERDADLNPQEIKKAIISSMPKPMSKRAHNKKKS